MEKMAKTVLGHCRVLMTGTCLCACYHLMIIIMITHPTKP